MNCPGCGMMIYQGGSHVCGVGHNCPFCSDYVGPGIFHTCGIPQGFIPSPEASRIANALESLSLMSAQIRDQLTKLVTLQEQRLEFDMSFYDADAAEAAQPDE